MNSSFSGDDGRAAISGAAAKDKNAATSEIFFEKKKRLTFIIIWKVGGRVNNVKLLSNF